MKMTEKEMRGLDSYLAENAMGWIKTEMGHLEHSGRFATQGNDVYIHDRGNYVKLFHPAAAMEVLKKCADKLCSFDVCVWRGATMGLWFVGERGNAKDITFFEKSETLELAICLFAKKLFSK